MVMLFMSATGTHFASFYDCDNMFLELFRQCGIDSSFYNLN